MSLKIYTYSNPYELDREVYWNEIKDCAQFCVSQTMVNGFEKIYHSLKKRGCLTTMRILLNSFYSDWEKENKRVRQIMEVDSAINTLFATDSESDNLKRTLEYNTKSLAKCIRIFKELGLRSDNFDVSRLNSEQKNLIDIYRYICNKKDTSFNFNRINQEKVIDEKIIETLKSKHKDFSYEDFDTSTVVIHGIHQFSPSMLCAIEDIAKFKKVILLFNYQEQYKSIYQTWLNIYSLFDERIIFSNLTEFKPVSLMVDSYPCNMLADGIGSLSNGKSNLNTEILDKLEIIEFENLTEFAGYCAQIFENARKVDSHNPLYNMTEQFYSVSGKVNDILRGYFPEQFGERHFLDYPIGHFFVSIIEMWDNEKSLVRVEDMSLIKECLDSGIITENSPGELLNTFNTVESYIEKDSTLESIIKSLKRLRKYVKPAKYDKKLQRIGYLNVDLEKLDALRNALEDLNEIIISFFLDFSSGGDNFNRFYRRIHDFIVNRTKNMESLDQEMKNVISKLLIRMDNINLPETGTFTCLKQTMTYYLSQDDNLFRGTSRIVKDFEQIDGDILRSACDVQKADPICYHFCCLSDKDICASTDERLPWPLDINFFECSYEPIERNYQIFLKSKMEYKNFKRYALLYGLEFNRVKCKLSYVKNTDYKENELYHLIKILGVKVKKYHSNTTSGYVTHLNYGKGVENSYFTDNEDVDKIKYSICPYRFALESIVQGKTIYRERFLVIFYLRILLQNMITDKYSGMRINKKELTNLILEEYQKLDDKFYISNEYEKTQIIMQLYKYFLKMIKKYGYFSKEYEKEKYRENFLVLEVDCFLKKVSSIDLNAIISDESKRYKENSGDHCKYCSSKDVCLKRQKI